MMPPAQWMIIAPLWLVALCLVGGLILSAFLGWALRRRMLKDDEPPTEQEGYIVAAVTGLLSLLVGFTFSMAIDRFDTRRLRVLDDANAIEAAYLKAQILPQPYRAQVSGLLVAYTDNKVVLGQARPGKEQDALAARNEQLLTQLWAATVAVFPQIKSMDFSSSFVDSIGNIFEMDAARKAGRRAHVPQRVYEILILYEFVAAAVFGYVLSGRRGREVAASLLLLFSMSMLLIIEIDRPVTGHINESQDPMIELQAALHNHPPQVFDRPGSVSD